MKSMGTEKVLEPHEEHFLSEPISKCTDRYHRGTRLSGVSDFSLYNLSTTIQVRLGGVCKLNEVSTITTSQRTKTKGILKRE